MDVEFNDAAWDGKKIPEGQQCLNYDGKSPATPSMTVSNIPTRAESLVFVYNDVSNKRMQHGGHGIVEFALPEGATSAEVPRVFGHTYEVPVGIEMVAEYRNRKGEVLLYILSTLVVCVGCAALFYGALEKNGFIALAGSIATTMIFPALKFAMEVRRQNFAIRLLEAPLINSDTPEQAAAAIDAITDSFQKVFIKTPSK